MPIKPRRPVAYTGNNPYIFVSYRRLDSDTMEELVRCLDRSGYNVWFDEGLIPANEWDEIIARRVESCGFFIALISKHYTESRNCQEELRYAWENERPCLLIYLDEEAKLSSGLKMHFSGKQFLRRWDYDSVEDMLQLATREPSFERCRDDAAAEPEREVPRPARPAKEERAVQTPYTPAPSEGKPEMSHARPRMVVRMGLDRRVIAFIIIFSFLFAGLSCLFVVFINREDSWDGMIVNGISFDSILVFLTPEKATPVEDFTYSKYSDGVKITGYKGTDKTVVIPQEIDGSPVIAIGDRAFSDHVELTSVKMPESVKTIGIYSFKDCTSLTTVTIPDNVHSIFSHCFYNCTNLTSVRIPRSVTYIAGYAFDGCVRLNDVYYFGSRSDWESIRIAYGNDPLTTATVHFNAA